MAASPLSSWGSPTLNTGTKIRNAYLAHMWAKWLHDPCRLGSPWRSGPGRKSEKATWHTCGHSCYITPTVSGVSHTQRGRRIRNGYLAHMWAKWLHGPCRLGGPWRSGPGRKSEKATWHTWGHSCYITPTVSGVSRRRIRNGYLAHMWAKWLHHPCRLGAMRQRILGSHTCRLGGGGGGQRWMWGERSEMAM